MDEMADVRAALQFFADENFSPDARLHLEVRMGRKLDTFRRWHESPQESPTGEP